MWKNARATSRKAWQCAQHWLPRLGMTRRLKSLRWLTTAGARCGRSRWKSLDWTKPRLMNCWSPAARLSPGRGRGWVAGGESRNGKWQMADGRCQMADGEKGKNNITNEKGTDY